MSVSEQLGLLGRKVGMTRIFTDDGDTIPVTVLDVSKTASRKLRPLRPMGTTRYKSRLVPARPAVLPSPKPGTWPRPVSRRVKS